MAEFAPRHTYPYMSGYQENLYGTGGELGRNLSQTQQQYQPQTQFQYVHSDRDVLTLPIRKHKNMHLPLRVESPEEELSFRKYIGGSVGLISLITENLLSHPFVVLRRQCQVRIGPLDVDLFSFDKNFRFRS